MKTAKPRSRIALEPAASIIRKLGGEGAAAKLTGATYTAPYRWQASREKGGTGGLIPQRYHRMLLDHARAAGIDLRAEDFLEIQSQSAPPIAPDGAQPQRATS